MQIKLALVVDDSKSARFSLKKLLQKQGIETDFAESAGDALNYLEGRRPDVIFMDHLMPGMDGFDATKAIKNNSATADIPVIMCTSKEGSDYAEQAMATGAYAILPKPAPEATLMAVLNQLAQAPAAGADSGTDAGKQLSPTAGMGQRAVESLVKKLLDDQLSILRKHLTESLQAQIKEQVELTLAQTRESFRKELADSMDSTINATAQRHAKQVATEMFDHRFDDLANHIQGQVVGQIVEIQANIEALRKPSTEFINEVKNIAQFTAAAAAGEAAKVTAADTTARLFEEVSQREMASIKTGLAQELDTRIEHATKGSRATAILALVAAICALGAALIL